MKAIFCLISAYFIYNVCIDYLKIRFNSLFSPLGKCWKKLIEALRCSPDVYDDDIKVTNYKKCYVFDANVYG